MTTYSPRDGIVLWELQEQKCQQRVCQHSDVVQPGQAGWIVLILRYKMVKFRRRSALVIVRRVANVKYLFMLKTVDPTSSTNFLARLVVTHVTVVQTEYEANVLREVKVLINHSIGTYL